MPVFLNASRLLFATASILPSGDQPSSMVLPRVIVLLAVGVGLAAADLCWYNCSISHSSSESSSDTEASIFFCGDHASEVTGLKCPCRINAGPLGSGVGLGLGWGCAVGVVPGNSVM